MYMCPIIHEAASVTAGIPFAGVLVKEEKNSVNEHVSCKVLLIFNCYIL